MTAILDIAVLQTHRYRGERSDIAVAMSDADDVGQVRQLGQGDETERAHGPVLVDVDDDGNRGPGRDLFEVVNDPSLAWLRIIGNGHQSGRGAELGGAERQLNRPRGRVCTGCCDDRNAIACCCDDISDHVISLLLRQGGPFPSGIAHEQPVNAAENLAIDEKADASLIDGVQSEGCDQ